MSEGKRPYAVGYKKPPAGTRFKPGQSGNLRGRPKGFKNIATAIEEELKERIPVTENGRRRTISKGEAIAKQLINKAIAGDPKVMPLALNEIRFREKQTAEIGIAKDPAPEDQKTIESIVRRIRESDPLPVEPPAGDPSRNRDPEEGR
jgi:Family of unknown function (DUF5681)